MKRLYSEEEGDESINVSPLIDVVFILLILFFGLFLEVDAGTLPAPDALV